MNHAEQIWSIAFATVATRLIEQGATRLEAARKADAIADEVQLAYQDSPEHQYREQRAALNASTTFTTK